MVNLQKIRATSHKVIAGGCHSLLQNQSKCNSQNTIRQYVKNGFYCNTNMGNILTDKIKYHFGIVVCFVLFLLVVVCCCSLLLLFFLFCFLLMLLCLSFCCCFLCVFLLLLLFCCFCGFLGGWGVGWGKGGGVLIHLCRIKAD